MSNVQDVEVELQRNGSHDSHESHGTQRSGSENTVFIIEMITMWYHVFEFCMILYDNFITAISFLATPSYLEFTCL